MDIHEYTFSHETTKDSYDEVDSVDGIWKNNVVELCGTLGDGPKFSHMSKERKYYIFPLEIQRLSGAVDIVNITAAEELLSGIEVHG